jgi:hypothetical protein
MKRTLAALLILTACAAAQSSDTPEQIVTKAAGHVASLQDSMGDVDSFGLDKVFTYMTRDTYTPEEVEQFNKGLGKDWIKNHPLPPSTRAYCYEYHVRNEFGGILRERAVFAQGELYKAGGIHCNTNQAENEITKAVKAELAKHKD